MKFHVKIKVGKVLITCIDFKLYAFLALKFLIIHFFVKHFSYDIVILYMPDISIHIEIYIMIYVITRLIMVFNIVCEFQFLNSETNLEKKNI